MRMLVIVIYTNNSQIISKILIMIELLTYFILKNYNIY